MEQTRFDKGVIGGVTGGKVAAQNIIRLDGKVALFKQNKDGSKSLYPLTPTNIRTSDIALRKVLCGTFKLNFTYNDPCDYNQTFIPPVKN